MTTPASEPTNVPLAQSRLFKLARKRLERYVMLFAKALVSDAPDTVHDLRVASRRLQQALRLVVPSPKPSGLRKLMRALRKVRRISDWDHGWTWAAQWFLGEARTCERTGQAHGAALARGHDPDRPRNLAKSVTVK